MFYSMAKPVTEFQKMALKGSEANHVEVFPLAPQLDQSFLTEFIQQQVNIFDSLRLCFNETGEYSFIAESLMASVVMLDMVKAPEKLYELIAEEKKKTFNLLNAPLFRIILVKLPKNKQTLLFVAAKILTQEPQFKDIQIELLKLSQSDDVKEKIRILWMNVMNLDQIKDDDNFFKLGGHSLLAVELSEKLRDELNKDLYVRDIFEYPTINDLKNRLEQLGVKAKEKSFKKSSLTSGPLSFNQTQVWYVEKLFPDTRMHNLSTSLRMKWKVNPDTIEKTVHYLFRRHSALRTIFKMDGDVPEQVILHENEFIFRPKLEVVKTREDKVLGLMRAETRIPFNLSMAPLFMAKLYEVGKDEFVFFFMVHHAVWDGWCFDIFFEEFSTIYTALEHGKEPVFKKDPGLTYLDYSRWQKESVESGAFKHELVYWKKQLQGPLPILELPLDFPRPKTPTHDGGNFRFAFTPEQSKTLKAYSASKNASLFNVLLTAFKITLAKTTMMNDIIVGSPIRGRNHPDLQQTIGYFVNTLALRSEIHLESSFEENLKKVTKTCLEAFSNQELPFEVLLKEIEYQHDPGRTAVFQSYFTFQDMTNRQFTVDGKEVKQVSVNNASVKTDFDIWVKVTTYSIEGAFEYRSDLFKESTVKAFYNVFIGIINQLSERESYDEFYYPKFEGLKIVSEPVVVEPQEPKGIFNKFFFRLKKAFYRFFDLKMPSN